jgi:hypothetical protein
MAHGVAGELWALLVAHGPEHPRVKARLAELAALRDVDDEGLPFWRLSPGAPLDFMIGSWCGGMVGHTLLRCRAARGSKRDASRTLAGASAETTAIASTASPTLCCGLAGQSFALQRWAVVSGDACFSRRAYGRLKRAVTVYRQDDPWFFALYQGALGIALVAMTRVHESARPTFPCIEPLGSG